MNKQKFFSIPLLLFFILSIAACSSPHSVQNEKGLKIVTTIFPQYDFARQIGGDKVSLQMLVTPGGESHSYEPTPRDIIAVNWCDIFICSGGESDVWSNVILKSVNTENKTVIKLMDCVDVVEEETTEGMTEKTALGNSEDSEEEPEYDEHVWTSIKNAEKISEAIAAAMCEADQENAEFYTDNLKSFEKQLDELDKSYENAVSSAKNKTIIFGDRFPFRYLFDDYGLKYYAAFPGCSTESDVSAKNMLFLINKVKENNLNTVYYIEFSARKIADTISAETGAEPLLFHSCHTVSKADFENGVTYIELMTQNLDNLKRGLEN